MSIDPKKYPANWAEISLARREKAGWRCEWCNAEYGKPHPISGSKVVLSVHHIGVDYPDGTHGDPHDKMDVRPENLVALCSRCHLQADLPLHIEHARETRLKKKRESANAKGQLSLFGDVS